MIIYYTHDYTDQMKQSRSLLERAIAEHLSSDAGSAVSYQDASREASRMTGTLRTAGEHGKPYISGFAPFSISHSAHTWAVLIADDSACACGLDIQYVRKVDAAAVADRFFAPEDAVRISCAAPRDAEALFFRIWARREALVKAAGSSVADTDVPSVMGSMAEYEGGLYRIEDVVIPDSDAFAAVCIRAGGQSRDGKICTVMRELRGM